MSIVVAIRWKISNADVGMTEARRARDTWMKSGANEVRLCQIHAGPYTGQWLFLLTFPNFGVYGKALEQVAISDERKTWLAENAKVNNVFQQTDLLVELKL